MSSLAINYFSDGFRHPLIYRRGDGVRGFNDKRFYNRKTNSMAF